LHLKINIRKIFLFYFHKIKGANLIAVEEDNSAHGKPRALKEVAGREDDGGSHDGIGEERVGR